MSMPGGFGHDNRAATAEEQAILDGVKGDVEAKLAKNFNHFRAISYVTQVVAGTNYIFKVKADEDYIHVKVAKPLPHTGQPPFLMHVDTGNHTHESPITPI